LINQIEKEEASTSVLVRRVIDHAHLFTLESVGKTLWLRHLPKLEELLTTIRLNANLDDKKLVGLCFAMALSRGKAFEGLSKILQDVPTERLTKVRFDLQHHLLKVHSNPLVANWLYENYDILDRNLYRVMVHANKTMDKKAFSMMTMA
jgi:hypothetical protein